MTGLDFSAPADVVAPQLLGAIVHRDGVAIRLTEVEAYLGPDDPASHAFRGPHGRAAVMYGPPGCVYVYLSYGIHVAGNLVCSPAGQASAVLMRAGEVVAGVDLARARRAWSGSDAGLARGPGNLGCALGLQLADSGLPLGGLFGLEGREQVVSQICTGPRVGISKNVDAPLRFWLPGEPSVSAGRLSRRQARSGVKGSPRPAPVSPASAGGCAGPRMEQGLASTGEGRFEGLTRPVWSRDNL